ncbi:hypothetical protein CHLRE_09g395954v5 [Chlamydomonas reinhardtii]|uniref:Uncharacterized protein n=1 Tax=Chlamydomonas reinhardtii TaxID=3055 RepID=A0A2K3DEJ7_CHLRE|nr:uncharacterized protein CHLRE_09g395954v5 [Chlamydomonas reinhardtii]PNW78963.1 hypothetical protein CHLRE_09g395954v5 [Chlamydomonas reinhardtii]
MNVLRARCTVAPPSLPQCRLAPPLRPQLSVRKSAPVDAGSVLKVHKELILSGTSPDTADGILKNFVRCSNLATKSDIEKLDTKLNWSLVISVVILLARTAP